MALSFARRINNVVRSILFNIAFFGSTVLLLVFSLPGYLMSDKIQRGIALFWFDMVYACEKYVMNLDYRVIGRENLPEKGPYIIACKHQSAWETMKIYRIFGETAAIIAKKGLLDIPIWGHYGLVMGLVPIDRSKGKEAMQLMINSAQKSVDKGHDIVLFPQGTRVPVGETRPYKGGVIKLYEGLNLPIVPVAINAGLFWPKNSFWKKSGTITVEILPIIPTGLPSDAVLKQLADVTETATDRLCQLPVQS
jgi:1-acyl-sn-glycerol-3-phosphate acyltransferase